MRDGHPRKLLVRGVNWLGDAVMTTPALMRLREALPHTHITLLTRAKLAELWTQHPAIDEIIRIDSGETIWTVARRLLASAFDAAVVLPNSPRTALEVWLARIPRRIGHARPWRNWFLTQVIPSRPGYVRMRKRTPYEIRQLASDTKSEGRRPTVPESAHQMYEYLHLVAALGANLAPVAPQLAVESAESEAALLKFGVPREGVWLGLNAGAEYGPAKRWPRDRFIEAARGVNKRTGCGCLLFGGPGDVAVAEQIAAALQPSVPLLRNVAGQTSLRELMALLPGCSVLLTNDTGPMHLAAALGVPVVVPFGSTSPELTGPGVPGDTRHRLIKSDAPCSPCFLRECPIDFRCMNGIHVERVVDAVVELLSGRSSSG